MLWKLSSEPKENEGENAKRRKVELLRLGLLSSALTLQRKEIQYDNLEKSVKAQNGNGPKGPQMVKNTVVDHFGPSPVINDGPQSKKKAHHQL